MIDHQRCGLGIVSEILQYKTSAKTLCVYIVEPIIDSCIQMAHVLQLRYPMGNPKEKKNLVTFVSSMLRKLCALHVTTTQRSYVINDLVWAMCLIVPYMSSDNTLCVYIIETISASSYQEAQVLQPR